jgi:hypothetical protein
VRYCLSAPCYFGGFPNEFVERLLEGGHVDARFFQKKIGDGIVHAEHALEQVGGVHALLFVAGGDLLGLKDGFLGFDGEIVVGHGLVSRRVGGGAATRQPPRQHDDCGF